MSDLGPNEWHNTDGISVTVVKDSDVEVNDAALRQAFGGHPELSTMTNWIHSISSNDYSGRGRTRHGRTGGLFERDRYVSPHGVFDQMRVARDAASSDDVVSNVVETTEALVFNNIRIECGDEDEENIWDQIIDEMELGQRLREMWHDLFIYSQFYCASMWQNRTFKVEGVGTARARRKTYTVNAPAALSLLDPIKVLPVGDFLFGGEDLVYMANRTESTAIEDVIAGKNTSDQVVVNLLSGRYEIDRDEKRQIQEATGASALDNTYLLNPALVWRHTATRPSYERFADVRISSIFELLDLKHQLRQRDRVHLLAGTNFIVLVKKGLKDEPATPAELTNLSNNVRTVARTPLIVGDHRLNIEIIEASHDETLDPKRYNTLDSRITARLYQIFHLGGFSAGASGDDSIKLARLIARGLEARRSAMQNTITKQLLLPIWRANESLTKRPSLEFTPRQIALDFDPNFLNMIQDLFNSGAISRETILGVVDLDQEQEFYRREVEKEKYDKVMKPREVSAGAAGRMTGGNVNGGGRNQQSGTPNPAPRRPASDVPNRDSEAQ
jgi:hypothetical protein